MRPVFAGILAFAACGGEVAVDPPIAVPCPDGQTRDPSGACAWIVPAAPCAPHRYARLGEAECQQIGAGVCAAPFEADGEWACKAIEPSGPCGDGSAAFLGERDCQPVGWVNCPAGFEHTGFGCRPIYAADCAGATRAKLGSTSCEAIGTCGPPAGADLFVDDSFRAAELDATHFNNVIDAVAAAAEGAVISIAAGRYNGRVQIRRSITLIGTCAAEVTLTGGVAIAEPGATAVIRNVTLTENSFGFGAGGGAHATLEDVLIERTRGVGVLVTGGGSRVTLIGSLIRDIDSLAAGGTYGRGVSAEVGGTAELRDVTLLRTKEAALIATGTSSLDLEAVLALETRTSVSGRGGFGVAVVAGARMSAARVAVSGCVEHGLLATGDGSGGEVEGLFVEGCGGAQVSAGVRVEDGAGLSIEGATFVDNTTTGLLVDDPSTTATVTGAWIARSRPTLAGDPIAGVLMLSDAKVQLSEVVISEVDIGAASYFGARLTVDRSLIKGRQSSIGLLANEAEIKVRRSVLFEHPAGGAIAETLAEISIEDCSIRGTGVDGMIASAGAFAAEGSTLTISRSAIRDVEGMGVSVKSSNTRATIRDSLISNIRATQLIVGQGISSNGARLEIEGVHLSAIDGIGVIAIGEVTISRTTASDTRSTRPNNGAAIALGGRVILRDVAVAGNQLAGVVLGAGDAEIDGLLVTGTARTGEGNFGHGLFGEQARVRATHLDLSNNAAVGIGMDGGSGTITRSIIAKNAVGAHAQNGAVLVEREEATPVEGEVVFTPDVIFLENGTRVGIGSIPIPSPFGELP